MGGKGSGRKWDTLFVPDSKRDPWDRQPEESDKAFGAFHVYRDLGSDRTLVQTAAALGRTPSYTRWLETWSRRWGWPYRCEEWDRHEDKVRQVAALEVTAKAARDKALVADSMWRVAARGLVLWNNYLSAAEKKAQAAPIDPPAPPIRPRDVVRLGEIGIKLAQLLEGKPSEITEKRKQLTVDDRRRKMRDLVASPEARRAMKTISTVLENGDGNGKVEPVH